MLFPTLDFLIFFVVLLAIITPLRRYPTARKLVLVAASYVFYAQWNWRYCFLLAGSSLLTYAGGLLIAASRTRRRSRIVVSVAIGLHLLLLAAFKYFDFLVGSANQALYDLHTGFELPLTEILLPVGISFFTFHGISYLVDVYRGDVAVARFLPDILLYLSFFPQLVAGPIVRAAFFLPQLDRSPAEKVPVAEPVLLILGGLFKKVIVANYLATNLVDPVFFDPSRFGALDRLLAAYGYAVQIFCDFSAYSDMAIGLAALLGYSFPRNFDQPYRSQSLREFWRRWHMSLSFWLRDYLYKPLGGSRGGRWFTARNLMVTMLLGGVWHGAAWKYVAWGGLHGAGLVVERWLKRGLGPWAGSWMTSAIGRTMATVIVFHVVCLGWIMFRADSFATAAAYLTMPAASGMDGPQISPLTLGLLCLGIGLNFVPPDLPHRFAQRATFWPAWAWGIVAGLGIVAISGMSPDGVAPFIYFQF